MRGNYDSRVKEWWPRKSGILLVKMADDATVDDRDVAKSIKQLPFHLGSYNLGHSKRLTNYVIQEADCFFSDKIYYGDTDSAYVHKNHWSTSADNGLAGKSLGLGENDDSNAGIFYAWFLVPKRKYCQVINHFGVISARRGFTRYSGERKTIRFDDFISLLEGKSVTGRFSIDWTQTFESNKIHTTKETHLFRM